MEHFPRSLPARAAAHRSELGRAWWGRLPRLVAELRQQWQLRLDAPFREGSCSWAAPARLPDGGSAVLKISLPHPEAAGEADALRRWRGTGAVRLLAHDVSRQALLLERCTPGTPLSAAPRLTVAQRLLAGARVLCDLWSADAVEDSGPPLSAEPAGTRSPDRLEAVAAHWADLAEERMSTLRPPFDPGLVADGVRLLRDLPGSATRRVVLHGDFHPGNVLAARRRPWLAIDPKPMTGDAAYDPWPLLEQTGRPFTPDGDGTLPLGRHLALLAGAVGEEAPRLGAWAVARCVENALWHAQHEDLGTGRELMHRARLLATEAQLAPGGRGRRARREGRTIRTGTARREPGPAWQNDHPTVRGAAADER